MMAHFSVVLAAIAGVSYVVFRALDHIITARRVAAKAAEWGCKEPPAQHSRLPLGLDRVRAAMHADREKLFPEFMVSQAEAMGAYTWSFKLFGTKGLSTHEPENIQAMLATQFASFYLGSNRSGNVRDHPGRVPSPASKVLCATDLTC